ncbi:hypothetical protein Nepgr_026961 [Nepenthes gracilis]|uniref:Pentatricopeptide repeat-containing protein n=1 Tax=Nepenthes gracilis TaxID=150966 RepID=A0AAD3T9K6_NEPGR|nr:hypothetical protein Nepgr_026961 [Nepenthes gracilis]
MVVSSLSYILRNCASLSAIDKVKQIHAVILVRDQIPIVTHQTDLLLAYSRCGSLGAARHVFDKMPDRNMHSWNILISSYAQNSLYFDSVSAFNEFLRAGLRPDHYTVPAVLKACVGSGDFSLGKNLHGWVIKLGFENYVVVGGSLLDCYVKFGDLCAARRVFFIMPLRDLVVWNMMISGLGRAGFFVEALECFRNMLGKEVKMDNKTIPSILNVCGGEGDLMKGKEIHGLVVKSSIFDVDIAIGNSLIDMYSKCGCLRSSENVFKNMRKLNVVTWTTTISCYGNHGKGEEALFLFERMKTHGFKPNCVTLTAILAGCSHSGLVDEGRMIFNSMKNDYGFEPSVEHYACMVDLLGRCGCLKEAFEIVRNIELVATASVWGALLSACVMHRNVWIGEIAAHRLFELEPRNTSNYIALCCIYDSLRIYTGVSRIRAAMRDLGLFKTPGCSWISIAGRVQKFYQGDISHPSTHTIFEILNGLNEALLPEGCG